MAIKKKKKRKIQSDMVALPIILAFRELGQKDYVSFVKDAAPSSLTTPQARPIPRLAS